MLSFDAPGENAVDEVASSANGYVRPAAGAANLSWQGQSAYARPSASSVTLSFPYTAPTNNGPAQQDTRILALLHFDGANGTTAFADSSTYAATWATNAGAPVLSTGWSKFGSASLLAGNGAEIRVSAGAPSLATGAPFTYDFWFNLVSASSGTAQFTLGDFGAEYNCTTQQFGLTGNTEVLSSAIAIAAGAAHHLAVTFDGTTAKLWLDGSLILSTTAISPQAGGLPEIGASSAGPQFYIDEFRCVNYVAYTATFTPPTAPYAVATTCTATGATPATRFGTAAATITYRATGFQSTAFGTPSHSNVVSATGAAPSTAFGTPTLLPIAVGFQTGAFGIPSTPLAATGFQTGGLGEPSIAGFYGASSIAPTTRFGTPVLLPTAVGFKTGAFGAPSLALIAVGFQSTVFGTPSIALRGNARALAPTARFGTPTTPTNRVQVASGWQTAAFGLPGTFRYNPVNLAHTVLALQFRSTRLGQPVAVPQITYQAAGTCSPAFGTPSASLTPRVLAIGFPAGSFGLPVAVQQVHAGGTRPGTVLGTPVAACVVHATGTARTRFGTPEASTLGTRLARAIWTTRFGQPSGKSVFPHLEAGFQSGGVGVPASKETHHALHTPPGVRFGKPLTQRNPSC